MLLCHKIKIEVSARDAATLEFMQGKCRDGVLWYFHGDTPCHPVTEADSVDFLQGNVVELAQEGLLDETRLRSVAGFLLGWIAAQQLPPSAQTERTVF
jgi:hypothetical protein